MSGKPIHADRLLSFFQRIEKLVEEREAIQSDIKDVFAEAKGIGYDTKTMRKVLALRRLDPADRAEQETLIDTYMHALGMIDRIEARVASGESIRKASKAEGMPNSTAARQLSQNRAKVENGTPQETAGAVPPGDGDGTAVNEAAQPAAVAKQDATPQEPSLRIEVYPQASGSMRNEDDLVIPPFLRRQAAE